MKKDAPPILVKKCKEDGYVLFPKVGSNGGSINPEEQLELYRLYSAIYQKLTKSISNRLENELYYEKDIVKDIVAHTLPVLLKIFFDLSFRVKKSIDKNNNSLSLIKMPSTIRLDTIDDFAGKAKSDANFNAELIYIIGKCFGLDDSMATINYKKEITHQKTFINNNSRLYKRTILNGVVMRLKKTYYYFRNMFLTPEFGVLNISTLDAPLTIKGLYGKVFKRISLNVEIPKKEYNIDLRNNIFNYMDFDIIEIDILLNKLKLDYKTKILYKKGLANFLREFYPRHSLEMFKGHVDALNKCLDKSIKVIITGCQADTKSAYLLSIARKRKIKIFSLQHGGYYGYMQNGYSGDIWVKEFDLCDYYLTWGWSGSEKNKFIPFVSALLSERKQYWRKRRKCNKYSYDIIIAPTRLASFSSASDINTVDDILFREKNLVRIVKELSAVNISILYKSPSVASSNSYGNAISRMKKIGGNNFHIISNIDKGLTLELLEQAPIILWDVVGTGFLECMACGIPTMVYVSSYILFEERMVTMLKKLETVGIVHTDEKTIAPAVQLYKNNTNDWFSNAKRKKYIRQFTNLFCNTSKNWDKELISIIQSKIK